MRDATWIKLLLPLCLLVAAGCSDDDEGPKEGTCQQRCESATECAAAAPLCVANKCIACQKDDDCNKPFRCDTKTGLCNYCESDGECGSYYFGCNTALKTCVNCRQDKDCTSTGGGKVGSGKCSNVGTCDGCSADSDCTGVAKKYCSNKRCSVECKSDADCTGVLGTKRCDTATGLCIVCSSNSDCDDAFDIQLFGAYRCL